MTQPQSKVQAVLYRLGSILRPAAKPFARIRLGEAVVFQGVMFVLLSSVASGAHTSATGRQLPILSAETPTPSVAEFLVHFAHLGYFTDQVLGTYLTKFLLYGVTFFIAFISYSSLYYNGVKPLLGKWQGESDD